MKNRAQEILSRTIIISKKSKRRSVVNKISRKLENGKKWKKVNKNSMTMWIFKYIKMHFSIFNIISYSFQIFFYRRQVFIPNQIKDKFIQSYLQHEITF